MSKPIAIYRKIVDVFPMAAQRSGCVLSCGHKIVVHNEVDVDVCEVTHEGPDGSHDHTRCFHCEKGVPV